MTFEELKDEYEKLIIGEKIYALLTELSVVVSRKYPTEIYNNGSPWSVELINELCQEVAAERLLGENQIHYIFREAKTLDSVRALFVRQIKRTLAARRVISPVDRLITRVKSHAKDGEIEAFTGSKSGKYSFCVKGAKVVAPVMSQRQIIDCANLLRQIPIIYTRLDTSRETMIFSPENLLKAMGLIFGFIGAVSEDDLRRILKILLTPWTRTILDKGDKDYATTNNPTAQGKKRKYYDTTNNPTVQGQERNEVFEEVRRFADTLLDEEKIVLVHKSNDISDESVASIIKKSRPTVAKIKADSYLKVKNKFLSEVDVSDQEFAMQVLIDELTSQIESLEP